MSTQRIVNVVFAGLGGQGVLTASDIFAGVAFDHGYEVKKSEIHGMSQRGGSVTSDVRFGGEVFSPMIVPGEADYIVVIDETQIPNVEHYPRPTGKILHPAMIAIDKLENSRSINVAMLGLLSAELEIPEERWLAAIRARLPEKLHAVNVRAFALGRGQ